MRVVLTSGRDQRPCKDGTVLWDGVIVPSRGELERKLKTVAASAEATGVQLRPNKLADYKFVAGVMAAAQRSQIRNLGVTGHETFL